jgi:predicted permease
MRIRTLDVTADGVDPPPGQPAHEIDQCTVDPGFFQAMGIPLLQGRNFDTTDRPGDQPVIIINQVMADLFWPGEDPLGRTVRTEGGLDLMVVGVARAAKVRTLGEPPRPFIYLSLSQFYPAYPRVLAKTPGRAEDLLPGMIEIIRAVDPEVVLVSAETMEEHLSVMLLPSRLGAMFSSVFAVVALILATIGLYGVVSYAVASRSREMGIRMSLGADTRGVVGMMVGGGMKLVGIGGAIGLAVAFLTSSVLRGFLFGVEVLDPVTFLGVPLLLLSVALLAAYVPARRATQVDPVRVLRTD